MRAKNMQVATNNAKSRYPGVTVYGIGDAAHALVISDHNEDDTPGSKAAQSDSDNIPEHRAIDIMVGSSFSKADADALVERLLADPAALGRLHYIIWNGHIWSASHGWVQETYTGSNQHTDHVHLSGDAADDDNTADWPAILGTHTPPPPPPSPHTVRRGDSGAEVTKIQQFLLHTFPAYRKFVRVRPGQYLVVDGDFGPQTEAWVKEFQRRTAIFQDGVIGPQTFAKMRQNGYNG